jgi:hypothetical protein
LRGGPQDEWGRIFDYCVPGGRHEKGRDGMEKIKIRFDPTDNSLFVWFADPEQMAYLTPIEEDAPGDMHLIRSEDGKVIGFECRFYQLAPGQLRLETETAALLWDEMVAAD